MDIPLFPTAHDPADVADYAVNFADLLNGQTLASVVVSVDGVAAAAGVAIGTGGLAPSVSGTVATFWLTVSTPNNAAFTAGIEAVVTLRATATGSPARILERSVRVLVRHSDQPSPSALAPVSLAEAKTHLRLVQDETDQDAYVTSLVNAAAAQIERDTGMICRARNVIVLQDSFFDGERARVPISVGPVNSIVSVAYDADTGTEQTLAANQYRLRQFAGLAYIVPAFGVTWPATESAHGAVRVTINAGHASNESVPEALRQAAMLLIGHWYENREAVVVGVTSSTIPLAYEALIAAHRLRLVA